MAKFSKFVAEAAQRGLLSLKKLDNGQIEIDLPHQDLAPVPRAVAATEPAKAERGRRGGRGRRGRGGRDRGRGRVEAAATPVDMTATTDSIAAKLDAAAAVQPASAEIQLAPTTPSPAAAGLRRALGRRGLRGRHIAPPPPELLAVGVVDLGPPLVAVEPSDNGDRTELTAPSRSRSRRGIRAKAVVSGTADGAAAGEAPKRRPRRRGGRKKAAPPESTG